MFKEIVKLLPLEALKILMVLSLSFLIGVEREEHKSKVTSYIFGGVRTFPIIGLIGYLIASLTKMSAIGLGIGFVVVGAFLLISYIHKIKLEGTAGVTTEVTGLLTYLLGALVYSEQYWVGTAIVVLTALLLELKVGLESLAQKVDSEEIITFTKFLLVTFVILPIVPNKSFTVFQINPFTTWLIVVAVSTISYGSYVLNKLSKGRGGALTTAILGGAYSSTATTIVLARRSKEENLPYVFAGSTLVASAIMYVRVLLLVFFFNRELSFKIAIPTMFLFLVGIVVGVTLSRAFKDENRQIERKYSPKNPLQLQTALLFAFIFILVLMLTKIAIFYFGKEMLYLLAVIMGFSDVDPFIMTLTQSTDPNLSMALIARAIIVATSSNNLLKGIYSSLFGEKRMGRLSFYLLLGYSLLGIVVILFIR
jgi:uncharacterized membrane protein (DUF4010 family)